MDDLQITIPVLNEEETIENKINELSHFLKSNFSHIKYKIVIADNGSTDKTKEIINKIALENKCVNYLGIPKVGVGLALKTSWRQSNAKILGHMDLDLATDLEHLKEVWDSFERDQTLEVVSGTRLHKKSQVINRKLIREVTSRIFNFILRFYLKASFSDGMCGFKFLKRETFLKIDQKSGFLFDGWFFVTEFMLRAQHIKARMKEIPVIWTDDQKSKVKIMKLSFNYLKEMKILKNELKQKT